MTKLASRIAGGRLMAIIVVLLLPMLLLGYLTVKRLWQDIESTQAQVNGLAIIELAMPVLIEHAAGKHDKDKTGIALAKIKPLAVTVGVVAEFQHFEKAVNSTNSSSSARVTEMARFFNEVGAKSKLTLDTFPESNSLGLVASQAIPAFVIELHGVANGLYGNMISFGADERQNRQMIWSLGRLQGEVDRISTFLRRAELASLNPSDYAITQIQMDEITNSLEQLSTAFIRSNSIEAASFLKTISKSRMEITNWLTTINDFHAETTRRLGKILEGYLSNLQSRFKLLLSTVLGCTVLAVGGAFVLFMRTLKRLDQVETERLRAEAMGEKVNVINSDLATVNRELADKMTSLKQAQDELINKRRMEQLGQLTATIAHEIRNPLGSVRTSAFLLQKKIANKGLGVEQQIDRINKGVVRCDNIITQLLDYSRTKSVQCQLVKLDDWLAALIGDEAQRLPSQVELECELGLGDRAVPIDSSRLQRAVINLLNNASEAMMTESRAPNVTKRYAIRVSTTLIDGMVVLRVKDTGPGISPENMAKVREPLFTTKSFGTGLGIPAIEQIAQQHGGRLDIESEVGQGATFTLYLPLQPVETEETLQAA
jgi:signal transduction histidine kinase